MFYRGSTVTLVFNVKNKNLDLSQIDICHFTIANDSRRNQRTIENCILDNENKKIKVPLSQNDTLSFEPGYLLMQFKIGSINNNDYSIALSNIMRSYIEQDMEGIAWTINPNSEDPTDGNIVNLIETIGDIQFSESEFTLDLEFEGIVMDTVVIPNPPGDPEEQLNTVLIKNKVYDIGVNPDWDEDDITSKAFIQNKPVIPAAQVQVDWDQADSSKIDFIKNKPSIPDPQIQSNWSESDDSKVDFIKNKPTKLSDFNNDQGFIDNTVNNLTNYYKKSETYTQQEVNTLISAITTISIEVVQELPTTDIQINVIYLVPKNPSQTDNYYDEYINTNGTSSGWEKIGDTEIDLSNYYTKTQTDSLLGNKVDKVQGKGLSTNDYDDTAKGIVDGVTSALADKVDKVEGYGLSKNDYTDEEKAKVGEIDNKLDKIETAVNSNGLVIATPVTDTAPYIYRQTPVKESFKALMHKIVGASVIWNQLAPQITSTNYVENVNASATFSNNKVTCVCVGGTAGIYQNTNSRFSITGHKYLISIVINTEQAGSFQIGFGNIGGSKAISDTNKDMRFAIVQNATADGTALVCYKVSSSENDTFTVSKYNAVDLTAMFGTTIADYVYTLETSQSGSGIAWLQSYGYFTEDYYAYKQNKLESGCVSAKKIEGKNHHQLLSTYDVYSQYLTNLTRTYTNGELTISGTTSSSNIQFYGEDVTEIVKKLGTATISLKDFYGNKNYFQIRINVVEGDTVVSRDSLLSQARTYNYQSGKKYLLLMYTKYSIEGTLTCSLKCAVQIEKGSAETPYEPYTETTYPISPITLRGLFKLSTDKLTVDGDEYNADGSVTRKYEQRAYQSGDESLANAITDGTNTIVKLATPTTEQTTPFTETEIVGSTEEFIDYEVSQSNRDVAIPVGTETDYYQEMKLPSLPTTSGNHNLQYNPASGFSWS